VWARGPSEKLPPADKWLTIGTVSTSVGAAFSSHLNILFLVLLNALRVSFARSAHRLAERVCACVHVALRRRDARVSGEQLQLVNRNAIVC
jgi:hypothetical protein